MHFCKHIELNNHAIMKKFIIQFGQGCILPTIFLVSVFAGHAQVSIIPQPVSLQVQQGTFLINNQVSIHYAPAFKEIGQAAQLLSKAVQERSGYKLALNAGTGKKITLKIAKLTVPGTEAYTLKVTPNEIEIAANSKAGLVYGIETLLQTLPAIRTNAALQVPCMEVTDYPRFKWRGMHLDVSRHFFSPELVKEYIDLMATYKMNTFHWHLVDDQGWRIEIKKYPKLTETGAWRVDQTDKVWGSRPQAQPGEKATYGGYYTQEQLKEIVAYAQARNITIVPEIEMPGHVASAIAAYPNLSCKQQPQLPLTGGNYTNMSSNYCAGNDSVFTFLQDVLKEVMAIFPSQYIHIGGDEVDKGPWKNCSRCQERIKKEGLKNEEELQSYFVKRMEKFLVANHRKMIGWDEILEGGLAPEATVMSWRGEAGGIEAAKMNHDVVMTPGSPCYFDHYQAGPEGEPRAIGGMNTLKKVYSYEPIPAELDATQAKYVLGAQANLWTEFITTAEQVEYMVLPRMLALAEVVWSPKETRDWNGFNQRLQSQFRMFDQKGYHYSKGNFKVDITPVAENGKITVSMSTEALNGTIYYTTDGSEPTIAANKYESPIAVQGKMTIKAATAVNGEIMGAKAAEQSFVLHKASGRPVTYANPISRYYQADGPNTLTNGVRGTLAAGKNWHGISGKDLVATVDLQSVQAVQRIAIGCLQRYSDWIFLPQSVTFEYSADGVNYTNLGTVANNVSASSPAPVIKDFSVQMTPVNARYIRVTAKVIDACPAGHPGAGKPGWVFADELVVE
jgi:hexosaminidase